MVIAGIAWLFLYVHSIIWRLLRHIVPRNDELIIKHIKKISYLELFRFYAC